jgi:hypothetical protein
MEYGLSPGLDFSCLVHLYIQCLSISTQFLLNTVNAVVIVYISHKLILFGFYVGMLTSVVQSTVIIMIMIIIIRHYR